MFIRTIYKSTLRTYMTTTLFIGIVGILLRYPAALATGISRGLSICGAVIIPTLYPFMILAGLLTDSPLCTRPGHINTCLARLFRLPACCGPAILLSLIGGYPAGALAIARLRETAQITAKQARHMTYFCVNGGPGFIVSTVGAGLIGSTRAGWMLFGAHAITSIGMGILLGLRAQSTLAGTPSVPPTRPRPIAEVVRDTCASLLAMCGFVLLAAAGLSVWEAGGVSLALQNFTGTPAIWWSAAAAGLTEVSCGCIAINGLGELSPFWLCLCLGWGGLSVQGQLSAVFPHGESIITPTFWGARLAHGTLSGIIATGLFAVIPADLPTSATPAATPFYTSPSASVMLLIFSFMAMLCFYPKKTGNLR